MLGSSIASLLVWAGQHPLLQAAVIVIGTFILEDAATVIAAMQADEGKLSPALALAALYVGIILGDLGLYGLGRLSAHVPMVARMLPPHRTEAIRAWLDGRVFKVVLISRFLPGLRLPTYTTCGFVGANLRQFALAVVIVIDAPHAERLAGRRELKGLAIGTQAHGFQPGGECLWDHRQ